MDSNLALVDDIKSKIRTLKSQKIANKENQVSNPEMNLEINKETLKMFRKSKFIY